MAEAAGRLLVPKGPRVEQPARPTVDEMREVLFALPLPPSPTRTRAFSTDTTLGRILRLRGMSLVATSKLPGAPSARQLSDALNGIRALSREHKDALARGLGVDRRLLD